MTRTRRGKTMLAVFTYSRGGQEVEWTVGCVCPPDNRRSMKAHFKKWRPGEKMLGLAFEDLGESERKFGVRQKRSKH